MARRRNTGLYEDVSPSLIVPDHFSTNQSSTIVIIYDEQVGMKEDHLTFVFPGEVSGGALKKVVPRKIDSRTFVLETPTYRALKRGFVYVTPQLRLYSGELAEMADFKISLKHPVRSVMEMCLNLSTQQAVLPVLLTLIIHSKQDQDDGEANHFFQDPHFDQIMATLVGSMEPKKHHIRDLILPDKKWKKVHLTEFARNFKMQEMEKQAYLLSQRSKEKKRVGGKRRDTMIASEDEDGVEASLFQSQYLSSSTPNINHAASGPFAHLSPHASKSMGKSNLLTPPFRKKKLPKVPKKKNQSVEDIWPVRLDSSQIISSQKFGSEAAGASIFEGSTYDDVVTFDTGIEEGPVTHISATEPRLIRPKIPKLRAPILPTARQEKAKEEDTESLDSYEEMNEVTWEARELAMPPDLPNVPPPLPPNVDNRPMMPIPTSFSPPTSSPLHYMLQSKEHKKVDETRPLPPEPKFPPPPSKHPLPSPKPPDLKNKKTHPKRFIRNRKDVYVSDSDSDTDEIQSNNEERQSILLPNRQKVLYTIEANAAADPYDVDAHVYDSAEVVPARIRAGKRGGACVKEEVTNFVNPPTETAVRYKSYENMETELSYDENPTLPPRSNCAPINDSRAPINGSPALPPRHSPKKSSNKVQDIPSHKIAPNKALTAPPTKHKPGPTPPPKLPSAGQRANNFSTVLAPKTNPKRTMQQPPSKLDQLSELSSVLSNRNLARGSGNEAFPQLRGAGEIPPPLPPVMLKKNHWKQVGPRNY